MVKDVSLEPWKVPFNKPSITCVLEGRLSAVIGAPLKVLKPPSHSSWLLAEKLIVVKPVAFQKLGY